MTHDHRETAAGRSRRRLVTVLGLTGVFVLVEVFGAIWTSSLALAADAGHMLTDVGGLALALFAVWIAGRPPTPAKTFGYYRVEILAALVNALVPDADREIGHVNVVTGRGRHTSTSAFMLPLPGGDGWIVDTPGIRSFGLAHVEPEQLIGAFPDLDELTGDCPRGCSHGSEEPEWGLDTAVAAGGADPDRVGSFRRLLAARSETAW